MRKFEVRAKYLGDTVVFEIEAEGIAKAVSKARKEARIIFTEASGIGHLLDAVNVTVREK